MLERVPSACALPGHSEPRAATSLRTGRRRVPLVVVIVLPQRTGGPRVAVGEDRRIGRGLHGRVLAVDGYVRSSGQGCWSASAASIHRGQIARWAAGRGWRLARVFEEPACTEPADAAPLLHEALARVESQESDGIVIARLNQIGCSRRQALAAIERIQAAGGTFVSIGDGIDLSTPTGRLTLRLLLSITD